MKAMIPDLPRSGPLEVYRKRATFDWKLLKLNLDGPDFVEFQNSVWKFLETTPIFQHRRSMTIDEARRLCNARAKMITEQNVMDPMVNGPWFNILFQYDGSIPVKMGVLRGLVLHTLMNQGGKHHVELLDKFASGEYVGCFALTEIGHGTNAKGMRTTATYEPETKSFVFNSADFEAAKCWAGGLGKTATHAIIFAKLITPDGTNHGLHLFIVPVRDPKTHLPHPGLTIGDMGEKIGLNGLDNGFIIFHNYRLPRDCLLNKTADVTDDGRYTTPIRDKNKRHGITLGSLSNGRVTITSIASNYAVIAISIAIRYSAARKQFGPPNSDEWAVLEYPAQQLRLFPHLAAAYALWIFSQDFGLRVREFHVKGMFASDKEKEELASVGMEIHALSSAAKPVCAWTSRDLIQNCRESCGGHGYLAMSRLGAIRADNDANCTYEGENNVLIQQASNWLVNQWTNMLNGKKIVSLFGSADFLMNAEKILSQKLPRATVETVMDPEHLYLVLKWLVCHYAKKTYEQTQRLKAAGQNDFDVKNNSQLFHAQTLSILYGQHAILSAFMQCIKDPKWGVAEREVLTKLLQLYALSIIEKRMGDLYGGGYASPDSGMHELIREAITKLCKALVPEAVALVDAIAPPDFVMNSPLGMADGEVYKHMEEWIMKDKTNVERPAWWKEICVPSKL